MVKYVFMCNNFIKGRFIPENKACISVYDKGVLYGDGCFEGIRIYNKRIFKLKDHIDRFWRSAKYLSIKVSFTKNKLIKIISKLCKKNKLKDGYIRLEITRGVGDLGLAPKGCKGDLSLNPKKCAKPTLFIIADHIQMYPEKFYKKGLNVIIAKTRRFPKECLDVRAKTCNYINNILAYTEANKANAQEAIMLDLDGNVTECTGDNIFLIKNNVLYTPKNNLLFGITRETVMKICKSDGYKVVEKNIKPNELFKADEVFLTGTAAEIIPVVRINKKKISDGKPGKMTDLLLEKFRKETNKSKNGYPI